MEIADVGALVLAGGHSQRMGMDKKALLWNGKTFLDSLAETIRLAGLHPLLVSTNRPVPGYDTLSDEQENLGPLEGIRCGLKAAQTRKIMILPVDIPQIPAALIRAIVKQAIETDAAFTALSHDGFVEPLISVADRSLLPEIEKLMKSGCFRALMLRELGTYSIFEYTGDLDRIKSINLPEEYESLGENFNALSKR